MYGNCGGAGGIALLAAALGKPASAKSAFLVLPSLTNRGVVSSEQADNNKSLLARMQGLHCCSALLNRCSISSGDANHNSQKPQEGTDISCS